MSIPTTINGYRTGRRLGSGAFATVWLAEDTRTGSPVAVKVLADNWAHHADVRERFLQEGRILHDARDAGSDRLVRVTDTGELPDGRPYLVMTYAAGGTLAERLAAGPMPVRVAVRTAAEIARGVAALHERGVIHRDLKPSNVLLDHDRVLVGDLGLAKAVAHASGFTVVAGSPGYMAPEQARPGGGIDVRADVYALGTLAYHMLTGQAPTGLARPSTLRPGTPPDVDAIVLRALQPDPRRRWPSAAAFADAMDRAGSVPARTRRMGLVPAALLVVAATLTTAASTTDRGWVRVGDASRRVSVAVPAGWARQLRDAGWDPWTIRLPTGHAPGLLVGTDLTAWQDPASRVPGVFVGASRELRPGGSDPELPAHDGCTREPDRSIPIGPGAARIRRWTGCGGTSVSFSEVLLIAEPGRYGLYVQVKQVSQLDRTDQVLRSVRVAP